MDAQGSTTPDLLERVEQAFADAPIAAAILAADGALLHANSAMRDLLEGQWGRGIRSVLAHQLRRRPRRTWEVEQRLEALGAELVVRLVFARSRRDEREQVVVQAVDVTEARRREARLQRLSEREPLTDLWNRRRFEEELRRQLARCRRYGEVATLAVLDVDGLKAINDRLGHACGDAVIRHVATTLAGRLRGGDALARIGGDEFAVLLAETGGEPADRAVADLCDTIAAERLELAGEVLDLRISAGYCDVLVDAAGVDSLFCAADRALYRAKADGTGCAVRAT